MEHNGSPRPVGGYIHHNDPRNDEVFRKLGEAASILLNTDRKSIRISSLGGFVLPFARLNQIRVFYNSTKYPMAYMTWGYLTDEAIGLLRDSPGMLVNIEELNAGSNLVVFDIISNLKDFRPILRELRSIASGCVGPTFGLRYDRSIKALTLREYRYNAR